MAVEMAEDKIEMTQNQVYGTQITVAESAARNQPSYQNIVSDGVQENSRDQLHQEACQHGVPMAVVETSDDGIEMTQNQVYGVPLASAAGRDSITMEANMGYGVTGSHQEESPQDEGDEYEYI